MFEVTIKVHILSQMALNGVCDKWEYDAVIAGISVLL